MTAMQEVAIETLVLTGRQTVHFVKEYEAGEWGEGDYAYTFCGVWASDSHVIHQKYSAVPAGRWCGRCYDYRRKAINREFGVNVP